MKIATTLTPRAILSRAQTPPQGVTTRPSFEDEYVPRNALEFSLLTAGVMARNTTPAAAVTGLVAALATGDGLVGLRTGATILGVSAAIGAGLGYYAYKAFEDVDIPS